MKNLILIALTVLISSSTMAQTIDPLKVMQEVQQQINAEANACLAEANGDIEVMKKCNQVSQARNSEIQSIIDQNGICLKQCEKSLECMNACFDVEVEALRAVIR